MRSMFAKVKGVSQAERETAAFFRKNYKELADTIKPVLEEMSARGRDIKFGIQEGRKYGAAQLEKGRLRRDAHSELYEEALQQMLRCGASQRQALGDGGERLRKPAESEKQLDLRE